MPRRFLYKNADTRTDEWNASFPSKPLSDEAPRQVFLDACAKVAAEMQQLGFKYTKAKQWCRREVHGFGNTIGFQSSHYNVRGANVQFAMYASVSSEILRAWQAERLPEKIDKPYFAGGMAHLLSKEYALLHWELADPADRAATIADVVAYIHETVLPYFALFEQPEKLIHQLQHAEVPALWLCESVDFAYCFGDKQRAQQVLNRFVRDHPEFDKPDEATQRKISLTGVVSRWGNYSQQIASLRSHYELD
jgi:hypothetical protein